MNQYSTLTEVETLGLNSKFNLADGHAYHDLDAGQAKIIQSLPQLWQRALSGKQRDIEDEFRDVFAELAAQPSLKNYNHYQICPTASQSIDIVGAWLRARNYSTVLLEPTFDNLALLLRRREVKLGSILEEQFIENPISTNKNIGNYDAFFLVHPNNPTGAVFTKEKLIELIQWCKSKSKTLILDHTFRFFNDTPFDLYELLLDSKVSFIAIEDTGKTWPTLDMKVSLLIYSKDIANEITQIYQEIFLCTSSFSIVTLTEFLQDTLNRGLSDTVWKIVEKRRAHVRKAIAGTLLQVHPQATYSKIGVEWLQIRPTDIDDFGVIKYLHSQGVILLPGRHFYWNSEGKRGNNCVRVSLLKPTTPFLNSITCLREALLNYPATLAKPILMDTAISIGY